MSQPLVDFLESVILGPRQDEKKLFVFMLTYKNYCTTEELFALVQAKYKEYAPKAKLIKEYDVNQRFNTFYKAWVSQCSKDMSPNLKKELFPLLRDRLEARDFFSIKKFLQNEGNPNRIISLIKSVKNRAIDHSPEEIAKQITLVQSSLFSQFNVQEMLGLRMLNEHESPSFRPLKEHFDKMSFWVATTILLSNSTKKQVAAIETFNKILQHLLKMNNFEGVMQLLSALNMSPVRRIQKIWKKVSSSCIDCISNVDKLMSPELNFQEYRNLLNEKISSGAPCIPWMALILKDLIFIAEGNKEGDTINIEKLNLEGSQMLNIAKLQERTYSFQRDELLYKYFENITEYLQEDQLFEISYEYQPTQLENISSSFETISDEESSDSVTTDMETSSETQSRTSLNSLSDITYSQTKSTDESPPQDVRIKCALEGTIKLLGTAEEFSNFSELVDRILKKFELDSLEGMLIEFRTPCKDRLCLRSTWHLEMMKNFIIHYQMNTVKLLLAKEWEEKEKKFN